MKQSDIERLIDTFAKLTDQGWSIPQWLANLASKFNYSTESFPTFNSIDWSKL